MALTAAAASLGFVLVLAVGARLFLEQRLTVGDRDLVIVGVDFREGEEAVPVPAVINERGLERWLHARHFRQIDVAAERLLACGFEIEFFDPITS